MSGADTAADGGAALAAIIAAAVDAFLREESAAAARTDSAARGAISAWRMAARTASGFGARGYGAGVGWRGID